MHPAIETSDLYGDRLSADLAGVRLLVGHTVRRIFSRHFGHAAEHLRSQITAPPTASGAPADVRATTCRNFRTGLLDYLLDTGALAADGERVRITDRLAVSATEQEEARALVAGEQRFVTMQEVLGLFEQQSAQLLSGEDGIELMRKAFGFSRMQEIWERLTLELPQRHVERTLGAKALVARMRAQSAGITVLECGAGIGAVLRRALEMPEFNARLPALQRYLYTDINPFLVEWGRQWFHRNAPPELIRRMEFRVLDLDKLPAPGVCEPGSVDLLMLDDVAHDAIDLHATLSQLHGALTESGWLAMTENFRQRPRDFLHVEIFAMTFHGYNRARLDPGRRDHHGFMTLGEWRRSLADARFAAPHVYPDPQDHERWPMGCIVAARAP